MQYTLCRAALYIHISVREWKCSHAGASCICFSPSPFHALILPSTASAYGDWGAGTD